MCAKHVRGLATVHIVPGCGLCAIGGITVLHYCVAVYALLCDCTEREETQRRTRVLDRSDRSHSLYGCRQAAHAFELRVRGL